MVDYDELKMMIAQARRGLDTGGLDPIQEVSAGMFFALGVYLVDLNDRLARLETPTDKPLVISTY